MKKHVIALGRQFGSGGREIGRKLSESLGFAYYDRELLKLAAERAEVGEELFADKDEKAGNPWLFKAFYQGGPKVKQGQSAEDVLFQMQSEIIRELAEKEDCIIVGRCADLVLTGQNVDCLSLFICAPCEWRVHHRMELENLDERPPGHWWKDRRPAGEVLYALYRPPLGLAGELRHLHQQRTSGD